MLAREFEPGFRIDLHHKDMGIALASGRAAGVSLPVTGLVAQLVAAARAKGYGSLDHSALLQVIEQLSAQDTH
jgi:2-hydroxy-3-oxopropionate reductase